MITKLYKKGGFWDVKCLSEDGKLIGIIQQVAPGMASRRRAKLIVQIAREMQKRKGVS